jgi:hypothetical protein
MENEKIEGLFQQQWQMVLLDQYPAYAGKNRHLDSIIRPPFSIPGLDAVKNIG